MRHYDQHSLRLQVARDSFAAALDGVFHGVVADPRQAGYLDHCTAFHWPTGSVLMFTRDTGHHSGGWWKNPDYESCFHLSLSFREPTTGRPRERDAGLTEDWLGLFFGDNRRLIWAESPFSAAGKSRDVWHYRLFVRPDWTTAILPRGEVYTRQFTERGWSSWSDVQAALAAERARAAERAADPARGRSQG
jgi:hypothetical protein